MEVFIFFCPLFEEHLCLCPIFVEHLCLCPSLFLRNTYVFALFLRNTYVFALFLRNTYVFALFLRNTLYIVFFCPLLEEHGPPEEQMEPECHGPGIPRSPDCPRLLQTPQLPLRRAFWEKGKEQLTSKHYYVVQ